jgi:hypothetical protein
MKGEKFQIEVSLLRQQHVPVPNKISLLAPYLWTVVKEKQQGWILVQALAVELDPCVRLGQPITHKFGS